MFVVWSWSSDPWRDPSALLCVSRSLSPESEWRGRTTLRSNTLKPFQTVISVLCNYTVSALSLCIDTFFIIKQLDNSCRSICDTKSRLCYILFLFVMHLLWSFFTSFICETLMNDVCYIIYNMLRMASVASTSDMILILMNSFSLFIYRFYNYAVLSFFMHLAEPFIQRQLTKEAQKQFIKSQLYILFDII